jgi:hypothetical protein
MKSMKILAGGMAIRTEFIDTDDEPHAAYIKREWVEMVFKSSKNNGMKKLGLMYSYVCGPIGEESWRGMRFINVFIRETFI